MADDSARRTVHHLNNLFQVILGSLELMKRTRQAPPETVETALQATREAAALAQRLLGAPKRPAEATPRARAGETLLLVEDDAEARRWASAALETLGYRVLQAADATAALEVMASPAAERLDLVFTDVVVAVGERHRGVPVLLSEKPYDVERLAASVRSAIDFKNSA